MPGNMLQEIMALLQGGSDGSPAPQAGVDPRIAAMQAMQGGDPRAQMARGNPQQQRPLPPAMGYDTDEQINPEEHMGPRLKPSNSPVDDMMQGGEDSGILDMIQKAIGSAGDARNQTDPDDDGQPPWFDGAETSPRPEDIEFLQNNPTDGAISSFIEAFGKGALPADMGGGKPDEEYDDDEEDMAGGKEAHEDFSRRRRSDPR